jgi:hypothetical protein
MANTLGVYNPIFYAQEALIQLEKALGLAGRVHRGIDAERRAFSRGEVINIRRPSTFTAANAPSSAADLDTETVALTLAYWREVKFKLTDKELAFTGERIIQDHIRPAAYALADDIDQKLAALYTDIPWYDDLTGTPTVADVTEPRKVLRDNSVPLDDPAMLHYMIDASLEAGFLGLSAFTQQQGAGDLGVQAQLRGTLGTKFGAEIFANQNTPSHVKGTCDDTALKVGAAGVSKGDTTIDLLAVDAGVAGTLVAGDVLEITGDSQKYAVTALNTAAANAFTAVAVTPALSMDHAADVAVTAVLDNHVANLMFHSNAFALAMAPLSEMGNELGAQIATVTDPVSGLAIRSRIYYVGNSSEVHVALDVLYGVQTLDPNLAVRGRG